MKSSIRALILGLPLLWLATSCTKLDTKVYDHVLAANFWQTPDQIAAGVAPAYSGLRNFAPANSMYDLNELSSDEVIVPTRGGDWFDNGVWEKMWKHTWGPDVYFFEDGWQWVYTGVSNVNSILAAIGSLDPRPVDSVQIEAELKTVRAFYYYFALDLFGNVPVVESNSTDLSQLGNKTRPEVFSYIENEIKSNLEGLTKDVNPKTYGRATRWFAEALLAKLYLNAEVYTGTPRWADCIAACDSILNANEYSLEPKFFDNFSIDNDNSKENIFVIPFDINANLNYFWLQSATLHYNSDQTFGLDAGGSNGYCSTKGYLDLFDSNDIRKKMFLIGQQYVNQTQYVYEIGDPADMQYDLSVNLPLNFDPNITTFSSDDPKFRMAGARCAKWEFNRIGQGLMSNDFAVFRLSDIILMKAEAQFMMGDVANALLTINQKINNVSIRSRVNMPDYTEAEMTKDGLLAERAREFSWEGWRRNDMIRLGHFTDARTPEKTISDDYRKLYPIPAAELSKNPYLKQNPGY